MKTIKKGLTIGATTVLGLFLVILAAVTLRKMLLSLQKMLHPKQTQLLLQHAIVQQQLTMTVMTV